jgi:hypothetical protein
MMILGTYGEGKALGIPVGCILVVQHVVEVGDLAICIRNLARDLELDKTDHFEGDSR